VYVTERATLPLPFTGLLLLPVAALAWWKRDWIAMRLLVFSLPTSITALAIYSGGNTPYYSVFHLCTAAILVSWAVSLLRVRRLEVASAV
jgi:hypothetical protein